MILRGGVASKSESQLQTGRSLRSTRFKTRKCPGIASADWRLTCPNSTPFNPWCWLQRWDHTLPPTEPERSSQNQRWSLQHSGSGQQPCRQARNMNQQVEHWSNGLIPILFLNLPQGDLVNMRILRQEKNRRRQPGYTPAS